MKLRLLLLVCLAAVAPALCRAEGMKISEAKMKDTIQKVVTEQLAAFRAGDYKAAYVFADQGLKDVCTLEMFEQMVRTGYPAIAHNISGRCGMTIDDGFEATVNVRVFDKDQEAVDFRYTLHFNGKVWRITGVVLLEDATTAI